MLKRVITYDDGFYLASVIGYYDSLKGSFFDWSKVVKRAFIFTSLDRTRNNIQAMFVCSLGNVTICFWIT